MWQTLYIFCQFIILFYFALLNIAYLVLAYLGIREVQRFKRLASAAALKPLLERNIYRPISILVPAYNEEKTIVASVRSFLSLHMPVFEIIVVSDGSQDGTVDKLVEAYDLIEVPYYLQNPVIPTRTIKRILRSLRYPNLIVIEKENGGRADAINAALNAARYPYICAVDADSTLEPEALLRITRPFVQDDRIIAVGGVIRPLNGAVVQDGQVTELRMPETWVERIQILEYSRAFSCGRAGWAAVEALPLISGAFGLFKREALIEVGGYATDTVAEDMELVIRLHRHFMQKKTPYRIQFSPDAICWTEVPGSLAILRKQRNRWHRGLWEVLWTYRDMIFNPRYGRIGLMALPYMLVFEALSPFVELLGYVFLVTSFALGVLNTEFAFWFLLESLAFGALLSQIAIGGETILLKRYDRMRDRLILLATSIVEFVGFRQALLWERFVANFQVRRKRGQWGAMTRKGIT